MPNSTNSQPPSALPPGLICSQRLAGCGHAGKSLRRSPASQIQMLPDLALARQFPGGRRLSGSADTPATAAVIWFCHLCG